MRCRTRPSTRLSLAPPSKAQRSFRLFRIVLKGGWFFTRFPMSVHFLHAESCVWVQVYNKGGIQHGGRGHAGSYSSLYRWDRLDASAPLASVSHSCLASGHAPRDLSAQCLCARELVLGGGEVYRSNRRISPDTRDRAEASPCRWPARRSGTAAASSERNAARQRHRLTRHPRAIGAGCMARGPAGSTAPVARLTSRMRQDQVDLKVTKLSSSVGTAEEGEKWKIMSSSTKPSKEEE